MEKITKAEIDQFGWMDKDQVEAWAHNEIMAQLRGILPDAVKGERYYLKLHIRHNMETHGMKGGKEARTKVIKAMETLLQALGGN